MKKKKMTLPFYISVIGKNEIAEIVGVSWSVVNHWVLMTRRPSVDAAWKLIEHSNGALDFNSIFEPYFDGEPTQLEMML